MEKVSFRLKSLSIYFELRHYIVNKKSYTKKTYRTDRGIGKTYNLVKLALKYDIPIFVRDDVSKRYCKGTAFQYFNRRLEKSKNFKIIIANENARGRRYDTALLEEGVDSDVLENIVKPMCKCIVGYKFIG